jgi:L-alanine-DL-glutamate epimerase-like enolase superfamily enzyme
MKNIKITAVEIFKSDIKVKEPFRISFMVIDSAMSIFIKISTDTGLYGMGEANPLGKITGETRDMNFSGAIDLSRLWLNKDPLNIEERMQEINRFLVHNSTLRSAFDMALYDLVGKVTQLPLYAVLGGGKRSFWTDFTIGIDEPPRMAEKAKLYQKQGFKAIKVKLGTGKDEDIQRVKQIRKAIGEDLPIRIDANQGWDYNTAVLILRALESYGIQYCEQPLAHWDYENMRRLREKTSIAIMVDESLFDHHDAFKLASRGCCDYFNIKLAKCGGIHNALKINNIAESAGISCMVGCMMETRLGITAAAHLISARTNIRFADLDGHLMLAQDPVIGGAAYNIGEIQLPDTPGHGADLDPGFLKQCESITIR